MFVLLVFFLGGARGDKPWFLGIRAAACRHKPWNGVRRTHDEGFLPEFGWRFFSQLQAECGAPFSVAAQAFEKRQLQLQQMQE